MDLVVDANILFAVLINTGKTEELFFEEDVHLFAPEFIFEEFKKYEDTILEKTKRTPEEFEELLSILKKKIKTIPNEETEKYISFARRISPDSKDADYIALALKLRCPLWTNDKKLKEQSEVKIYSTTELIQLFSQ